MSKRREHTGDGRYVKLHHYLLKTSAWLSLSAGARAIYIQIALRYCGTNNGHIPYSVRDAAQECNVAINTASQCFKELVEAVFIEETRHGGLSRKTRIASEWRLAAYRCDLTGGLATNLFMTRRALVNANRQPRGRPQTGRGNGARRYQPRPSGNA
jgi:hypothetical protein